MKMKKINRRQFLGQASCAGLGYMTFMNTLLNLKAINAAAISNASVSDCSGYKAIICILQAGGNDSFNTLMPYDQPRYDDYAATRSTLALDRNLIRPITLDGVDPQDPSYLYAVHPSMADVQTLFDNKKLAFLSNIGTKIKNLTTKQMLNDGTDLPLGLFSHSDQIQQWQTGIPSARASKGWGGRMADIIRSCNSNQDISMSISLSGTNLFQSGVHTTPYVIDREDGSIGIFNYSGHENPNLQDQMKNVAIDGMLSQTYADIFEQTYIDVINDSEDAHVQFAEALSQSVVFDPAMFPDSDLGQSLEMIARTIDVQSQLGAQRQIFFVVSGGWDHHDGVLDLQQIMLGDVSASLGGLSQALEQIGAQDDVLTMTISEFGRTLTSNGNGSDHAWGGNVMVMGGENLINGGKIYGDYPAILLDTDIEEGRGRGVLIPQLSTDEYFAEVAKWFGVSALDLPIILPNIGEFYDVNSSSQPIGFIKT